MSYEVHEHCFISGPNANRGMRLVHSHEGGDKPHEHADSVHRAGPGSYTIDKDAWFARTGLRGGGRKKFTPKPTGQQLPLVVVEAPKMRIVIVGDGGAAAARGCTGAGLDPVNRMQLAMKAEVVSFEHIPGATKRRSA